MSKDSVENLTKDLKDILLKTKQELKNKDDYIKKQKTVQELTKKEYQKLYKEHAKSRKQLQQYEAYMKTQKQKKEEKKKMNLKGKKMSSNVEKTNRKTICRC